jgi:putative ABC transport system permease protein
VNWWRRLAGGKRLEQHLSAELSDHWERQVADNMRAGMNPDQARRQARLQFGGMEQVKEECRDARGTGWVESALQDLRFSLRMLRKSPGFTIAAVGTLALGIGATAAMFSVVRSVLLKPLSYHHPDRLVTLLHDGDAPVSPANFLDWKRLNHSFAAMGAASGWSASLTGWGRTEEIVGLQVTEGTMDMLGVASLIGRGFASDEFQPGKDRVVLLSFRLWQRRFGGDPGIVGRNLMLNGEPYLVTGIMPRGFQFTPFWITEAEMWSPLTMSGQADNRHTQVLRVMARLKPGVSLQQARSEMDTIWSQLARQYPDSNSGNIVRVDSLKEKVVGDIRRPLLALLGAVIFVLLIACTNIANLTLARATERRKEMAIRVAMGAGRRRLLQQVFTESLLLSILGGLFGLLLAWWGVGGLRSFLSASGDRIRSGLPRLQEVQLDASVVAWVAAVVVLAGILIGLAPAFRLGGGQGDALKESTRGSSASGRGLRLRGVLIVCELAISLVLLAGAGLLIRSFVQLRAIPTGFDPHNLLTMTVSVAGQPQYVGAAREAFYHQAVATVAALPGVAAASMVSHLPIGGDTWGTDVYAEGQPLPPPGEETNAHFRVSRPGYFSTMRIPIWRGRDFDEHDTLDAPRVVVINRKLAQLLWPAESAIGKRLTMNSPRERREWLTVAGVIGDIKQRDLVAAPGNELYLPFLQSKDFLESPQHHFAYMTLVVRTGIDPAGLARAVEDAVWRVNKDVAVSDIRTFDRILAVQLQEPRFEVMVLVFFAAFALILAAVGIYAVMAYSVTLRTHEIGIRMALGARKATVLWMIVRQGALLAVAGISIGMALALMLTRFLSGMLYGVTTTDGRTYLAVPFVLGAVVILASLLPARRAAGVDPMHALRCE